MKSKIFLLLIGIAMVIAFVLGRSSNADAQVRPAQNVVWEYRDGANLTAEQMNVLGTEGWEMVVAVMYDRDLYFVFKRPK